MRIWVKIALILFLVVLFSIEGYSMISTDIFKNSLEKTNYACRIEPEQKKYSSFQGERIEILFKIKNLGRAVWSLTEKNPCLLSYHLLDENGKVIIYDNRRFSFPQNVVPGQTLEMKIGIISPLEKGQYILEFDIVREGISWFKDYGCETSKILLEVKEKKWPEDKYDISLDYGKYTKFNSSIKELNKIQKLIRLTLNQNEVALKGKTGQIHGFSAGKDYPQIWLRDATTIIPASRYFYDENYLRSWLEEHLAFQKKNGSLEDWIDSRGNSDKNTTETDQEASAVQAAYQIFELIGPQWLEKSIKGEKAIQRLERALAFLFDSRLNKKHGLLIGAHTPDWGDVDLVDSDSNAIYTDERTHWTIDIYDQSMVYEACLRLSQMLDALGEKKKAAFWKNKAEIIKKNANRWLWQEDKGFYRIHLHLDSLRHDFEEDDMFAMGGNAQAIISGLADEEKSRKIIREALKRQKSFDVSTISTTLLPPYPKNLFKHPLVDDPYEYQNGGQWDWFGGRLIYAMFEHGFGRPAREKLREILRKNLANRTFFEWDTKDGIGQGSAFFCGSAGSLSKAIFEGYFGFRWGKNYLNLEPRIGRDSAKIHIYLPANDHFLAYDYSFDKSNDTITLAYNGNYPHKGKIKVLSPWMNRGNEEKESKRHLIVRLDGQKADFRLETKNEDELIVLETDFKRHFLEIKKR